MFLYIDLAIITLLAVVMGYTGAYGKLVAQRPRSSLISASNISSLLIQIVIIAAVQICALIYLQSEEWYVPVKSSENITPCWENTTVFLVSCYQYIAVALLVSEGPPYRKHFYTNFYFLMSVIVLLSFTTLLLFNPFPDLAHYVGIVKWEPDENLMFRLTLLLAVGCNFFLALVMEMCVCQSQWLRSLVKLMKNKKEAKNEFKRIEKQLTQDTKWPCFDEPIRASGPIMMVQ